MYNNLFKHILDFILASIIFVCSLPIFLTIWLILKLSKNKTAFFIQERPGKNMQSFKLLKFKTMTDKKDETGKLLSDGQRLTGIGKVLRKTSLDELPQLINILKGEMSFIGPRPLLIKYIPYYTKKEQIRHSVKPGMTGLAQVSGRNRLSWDERLKLDVEYVEQLSFNLDLKIFIKTIGKIVKSEDVVLDANLIFKDLDEERKLHSANIQHD